MGKVVALPQLVTTCDKEQRCRLSAPNSKRCLMSMKRFTPYIHISSERQSISYHLSCAWTRTIQLAWAWSLTQNAHPNYPTYCLDSSSGNFCLCIKISKILSTAATNSSINCVNQSLGFPTAMQTKLWVFGLWISWLESLSKKHVAIQLWMGRIEEKNSQKMVLVSFKAQKKTMSEMHPHIHYISSWRSYLT